MPQKAAGWRIEPPVSDPSATTVSPEATAAAEPPLEPPGTQAVFQGLHVFWKALFSQEEPMANSSMLARPIRTSPAAFSLLITVAS